jgi:hypothetical protein
MGWLLYAQGGSGARQRVSPADQLEGVRQNADLRVNGPSYGEEDQDDAQGTIRGRHCT